MIRILLVHPTPTRGGFAAVVSQADELCRRGGFEVVVACAPGPRLDELHPASSVAVVEHPLTSLRGARELRRVIARIQPDIVHLHGRKAGVVGRLALLGTGRRDVLFTPHGMPWVGHSFVSAVTDDIIERLLLRRTAAVLCVSHHEVAAWNRRDITERIRYLPNPVPPLELNRDRVGLVEVPDATEWSRTILVPTGYDPVKRVEVVIEALALLPEQRPTVWVVGSVTRAGYRDRMVSLAADLGVSQNIRFDNEIRNVRAALREASLVVLPSFSEGLPVIGLEAIAEEACVAWSRIGGHVELFGEAGAPFWTAAELATIMAGDHTEASLAPRHSWLAEHRRRAEQIRSEYWNELEAIFRSGQT